jgi:hypothetical protein
MVRSLPPAGEHDGRASVHDTLYEVPLPRLAAPGPMNLRGSQHTGRVTAGQQGLFGGDLVGAIALGGVVVGVVGSKGGLVLGDRAAELRRHRRVGVRSLIVDVDGLAGDHHRRGHVAEEGDQSGGVGCGVAGAVDQQVHAASNDVGDCGWVVPVGLHEAGAHHVEAGRHVGGVSSRDRHVPVGGSQPAHSRPPDRARPSQKHRPSHGHNVPVAPPCGTGISIYPVFGSRTSNGRPPPHRIEHLCVPVREPATDAHRQVRYKNAMLSL